MSFVIIRITFALLVINANAELFVNRGYALKTNKVKTIPSGLTKSLTAFTAIYKMASLLIFFLLSSSYRILYAFRKGA